MNRGKGLEFNVPFFTPLAINLSEYFDCQGPTMNYNFELYGIVIHHGESGQGGHFTALVMSSRTRKWFHFNDGIVAEVNDINYYLTHNLVYILFYRAC